MVEPPIRKLTLSLPCVPLIRTIMFKLPPPEELLDDELEDELEEELEEELDELDEELPF